MIRFQRSVQLRKGAHALGWAKELTIYINTAIGKPTLEIFRCRFGNMSTVYWVADFEGLNALEAWQKKLKADVGYRELTSRAGEFVIDGTVDDRVLESV